MKFNFSHLGMVVALAGFTAVLGFAKAADAHDWSGFYVGAEAGYGFDQSRLDFNGINYFVPLDPQGIVAGLYAGANYQMPSNLVLGVEVDANFLGAQSSGLAGNNAGVPDPKFGYYSKEKLNGALRGRVGYASGRFMPFVAGGLAVADYEHGAAFVGLFSADKTYVGWTLGAGLEYAATDKLVLRAEYRYANYGSQHFVVPGWTDSDVNLYTNEVLVGVSFKF